MKKNIVFRIEQTKSKEVWYANPEKMKEIIDMWINADNWDAYHKPEIFTITLQSTDIDKYVHIYYNKPAKTQRFVLANGDVCTATIEKTLSRMHIPFTGQNFVGKYEPLKDYKSKTYKYAQKWQWLSTIDLSNKNLEY